jgi:tripartite ATP-independent transporter DctM subunit
MLTTLFATFTSLMLLRVPVCFAMGGAALLAFFVHGFSDALFIMPQQILEGADSAALLAIPFFIIAGYLMNAAGITDRIFAFTAAMVGHLRGGLAQVTILANMVFAGISGSALADIAGLGSITIKAMRERDYPPEFAAALAVAASIMAPIIPPSIAFIIYAALSNTSIARLFLAGIVPGIVLAAVLMIYIRLVADRRGFGRDERVPLRVAAPQIVRALPALLAPAIILIGIVGGFVTATEAGLLAFLYSIGLGLAYRTLTWKKFWTALDETMLVTALVMMILGFSVLMSWLLTIDQASQRLASGVLSLTDDRTVFLLILVAFLLFIGCFVESAPAKVVLVPVLLPLIDQFGIDRIQFGVIIVLGLAIGIATPPMGIGLFVASEVARIRFERITVAMVPLLVPLIIVLLLVALVPQLSLFLPNLLMGASL